MNLSKEEKDYLIQLVKSKWFVVLEKIYDEKRKNLFANLENVDMEDTENLKLISNTQQYNKWMKSLLSTAKWLTAEKTSKIESLR